MIDHEITFPGQGVFHFPHRSAAARKPVKQNDAVFPVGMSATHKKPNHHQNAHHTLFRRDSFADLRGDRFLRTGGASCVAFTGRRCGLREGVKRRAESALHVHGGVVHGGFV